MADTDQIPLYLRACHVCISKPGGLSSTEAAVTGTPLIHISPIPGCEVRNMEYFSSHGMSLAVGNELEKLPSALKQLEDKAVREQMRKNQRQYVPRSSTDTVCSLAEQLARSG